MIYYDFQELEVNINIFRLEPNLQVILCWYVKIMYHNTFKNERVKVNKFRCIFGIRGNIVEHSLIFTIIGKITMKMFALLFYTQM